MVCVNCNSTIPDDCAYCPKCGFHFPEFNRGKSTFDVEFLRKAFSFKGKDKSLNSKEEQINVKPKKGKFGWGWIIISGIVFIGVKEVLSNYGDAFINLSIIVIAVSLIVYYFLRNIVLRKISLLLKRSLISGFLALFITSFIVGGIKVFIKPNVLIGLNDKVGKELEKESVFVSEFQKKEDQLWKLFAQNPHNKNEIKNNIKIIEKSIPLYNSKDSVTKLIFNNLYSYIREVEETNPAYFNFTRKVSGAFTSVIDNYMILSIATQNKFNSLENYYYARLNNQSNRLKLLKKYKNSEKKLSIAKNDYTKSITEFKDLVKSLTKKYSANP